LEDAVLTMFSGLLRQAANAPVDQAARRLGVPRPPTGTGQRRWPAWKTYDRIAAAFGRGLRAFR
jgi:hypothetical protein